MSQTQANNDFEDDDDETNADLPAPARKRLRELEKENKRLAAFESENSNLKKQNALRDAGLGDLNEEQMNALNAVHKGDISPDALRKTAERLKFVEEVPNVDPADVAAHQQIANARSGATHIGDTTYEDEVATANSREELKAIALKHNRPWAE